MSFTLNQGFFQLNIIDHYAVLGISLRANDKEIRKRYLKIAQKLHPDTCKAKTDAEKELAHQLLAKLVNPAYEVLSKEKNRVEHLLIVNAIGEQLAKDGGKMSINFKSSKDLFNAIDQVDLMYERLLASLSSNQYQILEDVTKIIEQISELNLVYSIVSASKKIKIQQQQKQQIKQNISNQSAIIKKISPAANNLNRAKQYLESNNYSQAVLELKEALKLDPNSSTIYALLGLAYLKQNQLGMARTYVNKAYELDPKNPLAIETKSELKKVVSNSQQTSFSKTQPKDNSSDKGGGGFFGGLFGGKKK
jgi:curved DNA-binding protein CbpA